MKLVKMSLATAVLLGASAFAIDNVKVNGDAKLYYTTDDKGTANLFESGALGEGGPRVNSGGAAADTALRLGATGDLLKGVSFGVTGYAVSTLGLEQNLVGNTWTGAHGRTSGQAVDDRAWIGEAWLATTVGKTTAKVGRMELDTPLVYSEKWSIVPNTFGAGVLINQDLPDTTLVAAWVGQGNGRNAVAAHGGIDNNSSGIGIDGYMGAGATFGKFNESGAYAAGAINNSFKPLVAQAWYYNVSGIADAFWLQGDIDCSLIKGVKIGAQYSKMDTKGRLAAHDDSSAYAFKLGYEGIENLKVSAAYSKADDKGVLKIANVATNNLVGAESKLYTETFWNRGYVGAANAESWNVKGSYDVKDVAKFCASYTDINNAHNVFASNTSADLKEVAVSATKSFGPLDGRLAYISSDSTVVNNGKRFNTLQAYLTLNF
ncbi:MAG: OprD family outer membrane porin [Gammaproteobacteria bacterium]|nr:OprD family outer membrane porin [Gammaproteobacteria bacterium]